MSSESEPGLVGISGQSFDNCTGSQNQSQGVLGAETTGDLFRRVKTHTKYTLAGTCSEGSLSGLGMGAVRDDGRPSRNRLDVTFADSASVPEFLLS